ncbi:MAG: DUF2149 domain-containing protein [Oscillospiraceae bacterium]|nr:DUF2149 domain-containing protein [Oscillospiraceae bacterium]MCD7786401.1 DUF2149 domain-containing protein [Oscillospiraceae bacterium]MCD7853752.1 DUF2149 domain-containing protein [Oscillospiraceae bacterium]MCD8128489.1 DUF2149 domain-containing protein [Oscillospiraceae bacterium]MCD8358740.1 DUF2149 domain-containing protein [Oscillospiraceae bacterium]
MRNDNSLHNRRRYHFSEEDISPMEGVANLVDVMLVFACGLMLALIINWNVDLTAVIDREKLQEVTDTEEVQEDLDSMSSDRFEDMGSAYMDPETGRVYIISGG